MTTAELQMRVKGRLQKTYANPSTVAQYMGGVSRVLKRVPIEAFGSVVVMRQYRQLLSEQTRKVFGIVWRKIFDEMMASGLPCVAPEELVGGIRLPIMLSRAIDLLATRSSLAIVGEFRWEDVQFDGQRAVIWNAVLEGEDLTTLKQVAEYCWPGQTPDPKAPIIPLHPECPMVPMPVEMVEDAVNDMNNGGGHTYESMSAYILYNAMADAGMPLIDIEDRLARLEDVSKMKRGPRARANGAFVEVAKAIKEGDRRQFDRLWGVAMAGEYDVFIPNAPKAPPVTWSTPRQLVDRRSDGSWLKVINLAKDAKTG